MRKLEPRTQEGYIRAVRKLTTYLKRSPDTATVEDLRNFCRRRTNTPQFHRLNIPQFDR